VTTADYVDSAPFTIWTSDEPIADPEYYSALKVAEAASDAVTVLLSGTGADELFGRYGHHVLSPKRQVLSLTPGFLRPLVSSAPKSRGFDQAEMEALSHYRSNRSACHALVMSHLSRTERSDLLRSLGVDGERQTRVVAAYEQAPIGSADCRQLLVDTVTYHPDQLLPLLDRTTMAYSIEGRVPYLDHRVVEAALRRQQARGRGKGIAGKHILRGRVPSLVLERPKVGFPDSVLTWLRGELGDLIPGILEDPDGLARQHVPSNFVRSLTGSKQSMLARWPLVNALLTLQIWHRVFVTEAATSPPVVSLRDLYGLPLHRSST